MTNKATAGSQPGKRSPRPARPAVPPMPLMDKLDGVHRKMMLMLERLDSLVDHLEREGVDAQARSSAQAICDFFAKSAREHHAVEESQVFPPLIRKGDEETVHHVLRLQQDHGWLEEDWMELEPQLQAVAHGYSWYDLTALRYGAGVFSALYHEHIALEEAMVYPAARKLMSDETGSRDHRVADSGKA